MALSNNSGYCETCGVHRNVLRRLYDGVTFTMMCEACFQARHYRVKTGSSRDDHRRVLLCGPDLSLIYPCIYANLGCNTRSNNPMAIEEHFRWCRFASLVTCTKCWQVLPVADYDAHTNGTRGDLWL
ncbi:hypothetical protein AB1N83_007623 [Pleurotus pulmonarius]|nr:hypothetical protein EYR38_009948 [Pleurotus pulmonarius]